MNMTDLEMDLLLAQAEVATLKRAAAGNMFTVPDDYVKVVRCKNCEWYQDSKLIPGMKFCYRLIDRNGEHVGYNFADDDFCSYGKLKDGDNHG